jgi:hypothetical protein
MILKKAALFVIFITIAALYLYFSVWKYSSNAWLFVALSIFTYVSSFITLYRRMRRHVFSNPRYAEKLTAAFSITGMLLFFSYIVLMVFSWKRYDWRLLVDNRTGRDIEFTVNGQSYFSPNNNINTLIFPLEFHGKQLSVNYSGQHYVLDEAGDYVFNVDSANSYYIVKHKIEYEYLAIPLTFGNLQTTTKSVDPVGFKNLTDSITDTICRRQFFQVPYHRLDYWFEYPKIPTYSIVTDKKGNIIKRKYPDAVYSIQRVTDYEKLKAKKAL